MLLLAVVLVMLRLADMAVRENFYGPGPLAVTRDIVVPAGGGRAAADALHNAGALTYPLAFRIAAWATRSDGKVHAGEFRIPAHASLSDILAILRHGAPVEHQVTIPEGLTAARIANILNGAAAATGSVNAPAEGAALPQTYDYIFGTPRAAILARAEAAMGATLASAWAARDAVVPLASARDALVLASIVQEETPLPSELPEIAAVYENRLVLGMKLQADPTVIYAASAGALAGGAAISRADLANPSAYNTYIYAGLPPGPICAPGLAAILAVLHPAPIADLYFVATGYGGHVFSLDYPGQLRNVARYRQGKQAAPAFPRDHRNGRTAKNFDRFYTNGHKK